MVKLRPSLSQIFTHADYEFCKELMKVGHVHTLSHQVELIHNKAYLSFADNVGDNKCEGLKLPDNWLIESVSGCEGQVRMLFRIRKEASNG